MSDHIRIGGLHVAPELKEFIEREVLKGSGIAKDTFWTGLEDIVEELVPRNRELLAERDRLQVMIATA
ncbi:hypothetical protein NQ152_03015 [Microbacterium sp. zg.B48]|uniref:hypothetical protein n=1 Tax=Microbacterium sp. zg.B48 TaxID=2969408 RepID=UPI00214ADCAE|nr:hypothetical protein [Microbacterium sp. zg.B48]MCR2762475.1 hypothetical protein [Microbacterium sp. zg.B48]